MPVVKGSVPVEKTTCPIIMNANAGAFRASVTEEQMREMAASAGLECEVISTSTPDEMEATLKRLVGAGTPRVVVCGGDGTVSKAVQVFAHSQSALGIIPQGTYNNFATALGLPTDVPEALAVIKDGQIRQVSLGKIGHRYFTEVAGVGLFADALALYGLGTNKSPLRGLYALWKVFFSMRSRQMKLTVDGNVLQQRAVWCTVANTYRMAQGLEIAPDARPEDDHLDVVIIGNLSRFEFIRYYRAIRNGTHRELPKVSIFKARTVLIETRGRANVHADDAVIARTPVTVEVQAGALRVLSR